MIEQSILQYLSIKADQPENGGFEMLCDESCENVLVQGEGEEKIKGLKLFTSFGEMLHSMEIENRNQVLLNLEEFRPGNYEIHLQTNKGWKSKMLRIKERKELAIA